MVKQLDKEIEKIMEPNFTIIDDANNMMTLAANNYYLERERYIEILEKQGYIKRGFGNYEDYNEKMVHHSVNSNQISESGYLDEFLDQRLVIDI